MRKARDRLAAGENEEALFHAGRAFDGYVKNVLVTPLRAALVERLQRFMPHDFPLKQNDLFKSVTGLGVASAFAEYTISLITPNNSDTEAIIKELRELLNGGNGPSWRERDRAFHAPVEVERSVAETLVERAASILK